MRFSVLLRGHRHTFDKWLSPGEIYNTGAVVKADDLAYSEKYRKHSAESAPSPRLCVRWALDSLNIAHESYAFVDIGSGRGRVLSVAARYPFREVLGIEMDAHLAAQAQANMIKLADDYRQAKSVNSSKGNALDYKLPSMHSIFFLFNPFDRKITKCFTERMIYRKNNGYKDIIIFLNLKYDDILFDSGFDQVPIRGLNRFFSALFSPYPIKIFI